MAKCEVIDEGKVFKLVVLQITLESQAELDALYCVVNASSEEVFAIASDCCGNGAADFEDWDSVATSLYFQLYGIING